MGNLKSWKVGGVSLQVVFKQKFWHSCNFYSIDEHLFQTYCFQISHRKKFKVPEHYSSPSCFSQAHINYLAFLHITVYWTLMRGHSVEHHVYHHNDDVILIDVEENSSNVWQTVEENYKKNKFGFWFACLDSLLDSISSLIQLHLFAMHYWQQNRFFRFFWCGLETIGFLRTL